MSYRDKQSDPADPRGLIREAYRIEGISDVECRSIFLDWAIGRGETRDVQADIRGLLERHDPDGMGHPMSKILLEGIAEAETPRRKGGRRAKFDG